MKKLSQAYCTGCEICLEICPKKVFEKGKDMSELGFVVPCVVRFDDCIDLRRLAQGKKPSCELCLLACPHQAMTETIGGVEE